MYKVVLIDDEPVILEGMTRGMNWEKWNCQVVGTAGSGQEGLELIEKEKPHIVFTDIAMAQMDGLTMLAGIKSQHDQMQVCILTGYRDFDYAQQAIRLGVARFLLKPSKMDELEEAMEVMTDRLKEYQPARLPEGTGKKDILNSPANNFIVKNALVYIEENYREKLKLSDVAEHTYVSQWHLSKLLNRQTGQSFSDILNNIRIDKAKELLRDPSLRIGNIAEEVGFLDIAHFSRVFKKVTGVSANEYRNKIM
ncbi:response regulator transcription factor [Muricomes intestini]|jgi:two-component system response regulator YesN|uniref:Stage 0 sporulation protein A homolog n=1 Tax=Muricomes intestini TaxID=1796634 RepID=A0A4R3K983_9FIRM|nr:response regulator [Muricomes intestini]TCS79507.1 two-component system response regulator YesN [Muricomes intestini]HAX53458.1 DNA-binding response regulator [Lachnospiraceae bacterium]HCR84144.1 DNA-binding response regulator [Lachnospiraceae bacterium]